MRSICGFLTGGFPTEFCAGLGKDCGTPFAEPTIRHGNQLVACVQQRAGMASPRRYLALLEQVAQLAGMCIARGFDAFATSAQAYLEWYGQVGSRIEQGELSTIG